MMLFCFLLLCSSFLELSIAYEDSCMLFFTYYEIIWFFLICLFIFYWVMWEVWWIFLSLAFRWVY
jgi:hypothetical protein